MARPSTLETGRHSRRDPLSKAALFDSGSSLAPERLAALIDRRRELLEGLDNHPTWAAQAAELSDLLKSLLLSSGSLRLQRIDAHTPAPVLDKIVRYEAVHPMRDSRDLERRIAADRRCYAFFHPALPGEPLIFTELALTRGMSSNVQALLDPESAPVDPSTCTCAIFFSISSCHEGLKGVPLGTALIGRVVDELQGALPRLETFATLSPVVGFRAWLTGLAQSGQGAASASAAAALASIERSDWYADIETSAEAERQIMPLCAHFLLRVKRADEPADPVARFHLRNGARLERLNWLSDNSVAGMNRSAGVTVNYFYRCNDPRRAYDASTSTRRVNASRQITRLAGLGSLLLAPRPVPARAPGQADRKSRRGASITVGVSHA